MTSMVDASGAPAGHTPRVDVSVCGAFHAFSLAAQLDRHGMLRAMHTSYPRDYARKRFGIALRDDQLRANYLQFASELSARLRPKDPESTYWVRQAHDALVARTLRAGADIFVGWSGCSLRSFRRAKDLGLKTVVVRGSTHILEQMRLLDEEHRRVGVPFEVASRTVAQELEEYALADFIQTNSSFAARTFVERGIAAERIIMVNTGVDLSRFRPVKKNDDVFRVVTCGSLSVQKGTHVLLEAFERATLPGAELVLIGPVLPQLESLAARYASSRVRFVGHVANAELYQWFSQGDVFVMPSIQEGLAAVQAQAMACGLPLISSASSGGEDLIGPDGAEGFIVKTGDSEALRERLEWCFDHRDECRAMGQAALARAGQALTWSAYGERIAAHYRAMTAR